MSSYYDDIYFLNLTKSFGFDYDPRVKIYDSDPEINKLIYNFFKDTNNGNSVTVYEVLPVSINQKQCEHYLKSCFYFISAYDIVENIYNDNKRKFIIKFKNNIDRAFSLFSNMNFEDENKFVEENLLINLPTYSFKSTHSFESRFMATNKRIYKTVNYFFDI